MFCCQWHPVKQNPCSFNIAHLQLRNNDANCGCEQMLRQGPASYDYKTTLAYYYNRKATPSRNQGRYRFGQIGLREHPS